MVIWRRLAGRTIAMSEPCLATTLLNEPIPHYPKLAYLNLSLENRYSRNCRARYERFDGHHILFLGEWRSGTRNFYGLSAKPFDANVAYTFHKYWTAAG